MRIDLAPETGRFTLLDMQAAPFEQGYVLRRGLKRMVVEAPDLPELLGALIDTARAEGGATEAELADAVPTERRPLMEALVAALRQRGFLVPADAAEAPGGQSPHEEVFYWSYGTSAARVRDLLGEARLAVIGVNHVGAVLARALRELGFGEVTLVDHPMLRNVALADAPDDAVPFDDWSGEELPDCLVLAADFGGPDLAREWNAFCVEQGVTFFPALLVDHQGLVGPLVLPGRSACFECATLRERATSAEIAQHRATDGTAYFTQGSFGFLRPLADQVAQLAATELLKYYSRALPGGNVGRLIEYDMLAPSLTARRVLKVPRCPVCGPVRREPTAAVDVAVFMPGND